MLCSLAMKACTLALMLLLPIPALAEHHYQQGKVMETHTEAPPRETCFFAARCMSTAVVIKTADHTYYLIGNHMGAKGYYPDAFKAGDTITWWGKGTNFLIVTPDKTLKFKATRIE